MRRRTPLLDLFPPGVASAELTRFADATPLREAETEAVARAVAKRAAEFRAGRHCAREALAALGHEPVAIPRREDRAPAWPRGVVGSISHCEGYCGAVVGWRRQFAGLGLDVERRGRADARLWRQFATPAELEALRALPGPEGAERATLLFSAKEAFYKAQHAVTGRFLAFGAVSVRVPGDARLRITLERPVPGLGPAGTPFEGRYRFGAEHVFSAVALPGDDPEPQTPE